MSFRRKRRNAFTLVELLLVLIILALIGGLVLPNIIGRAEGAKVKAASSQIDRLAMEHLLGDLERVQQRMGELEQVIAERCASSDAAILLTSMLGAGAYTATALACRVGRVQRFPRSHSLANYWGLTPGCRDSGEIRRPGSITKAGSTMARWLLAQMTRQVLRKDASLREWFKRIKRRRGSSIARVAVMRKLATIIWHMLMKKKAYAECRAIPAN